MPTFSLEDIDQNQLDNDYYSKIVLWIWEQDSGTYPIKSIAKKQTKNKFLQHVMFYESLRRAYCSNGINKHWHEITITDNYEYIIIRKW